MQESTVDSKDSTALRRLALIKEIPLFEGVSEKQLSVIVQDLRSRDYKKDELIFRQGDESREVYLVLKGKVRIYKISPSGNETSIDIFSTHNLLGEFAALDNEPRSASAKAIGAVTLLTMAQERFLDHANHIPGLAMNLARLLAQKLRSRAAYAESLAQFDAAGRLLHILLDKNERYGEVIEPGKQYLLNLALSQSDLASMVGARREWINRILSEWRRRGLIEFDNGVITILDLPRVIAERDSRIEANQAGDAW
ncbi:MAG: Crp/Fnr family transcriptional regulator [Caldilineaceae bacterium]|nr:Crp/Fnr family transcriptional regulator [Caldilineaceae bacterium]